MSIRRTTPSSPNTTRHPTCSVCPTKGTAITSSSGQREVPSLVALGVRAVVQHGLAYHLENLHLPAEAVALISRDHCGVPVSYSYFTL
eukprot:5420240-Pyramimonas_sp.AAC.1